MYPHVSPLPTCRPRRQPGSRGGFTIMELLLVMSLLIMIGAISAPNFAGWAENQRLRKSGDIIRTAWSRARIKAMKSGQTIVFRYEIGGNRYRMEAWMTPGEMTNYDVLSPVGDDTPLVLPSADGEDAEETAGNTTDAPMGAGLGVQQVAEQILPRGITFVGSEIEMDARSLMMGEQLPDEGFATNWSSPILFYPDGSASQTKLHITDSKAIRFVVVSLRGITGLSQVSDILSEDVTETLTDGEFTP